jgi:hypothetical protein
VNRDFTLDDFRAQLDQMRKVGMPDMIARMPGLHEMICEGEDPADAVRRVRAIIDSMTAAERRDPADRRRGQEADRWGFGHRAGGGGAVPGRVRPDDGGKEKHAGKLSIAFKARKGTPTGSVTLRWRSDQMNGAVGDMDFELVEKDGKRFINVKDATGKEVVLRLEYSVAKDVLTIKGAVSKAWTGIFDDLTKAVAFKPGK